MQQLRINSDFNIILLELYDSGMAFIIYLGGFINEKVCSHFLEKSTGRIVSQDILTGIFTMGEPVKNIDGLTRILSMKDEDDILYQNISDISKVNSIMEDPAAFASDCGFDAVS